MGDSMLDLKSDQLFDTVSRLGHAANRPFFVLNKEFEIIEYSELLGESLNLDQEEVRQIESYKVEQKRWRFSYRQDREERLLKGEVVKEKFYVERRNGIQVHLKLECLPFQNEQNEVEYILIFVEDNTYKQGLKKIEEMEREIFLAIQQQQTFEEKMTVICKGIKKMVNCEGLVSMVLKKAEAWETVYSRGFANHNDSQEVTEAILNDYYNRCLAVDTFTIYEDFNILQVPSVYQHYAKENNCRYYAVLPIIKMDGERLGQVIFYFDKSMRLGPSVSQLTQKVIDLILLVISYEEQQKEIRRLAYTDLSTGMPNRNSFLEKICTEKMVGGTLYLMEPIEFVRLVEVYGHAVGEQLLSAVYHRIITEIGQLQVQIGRFSNTSIVLFTGQEVIEVYPYEQLIQNLQKTPYIIGDIEIYITFRSGSVVVTERMQMKDAFRYADNALSDARERPGVRIAVYNEKKEAQLSRELEVMVHLVHAVKNKEFQPYLQPKVELRRRRIASMEALARWISPTLGFVSPAEFIPLAEKTGLIREIDLQIIEMVLKWFQQRQYEGKRIVPIALNISPEHFYHPIFISSLDQLIQKYYTDPKYLIIEVTETLGLVNIERAQEIIKQLFLRGIKTSVDDFGMGYSSLSYLQKLNFTELKIDRSFTSRIHEEGTYAIVKALVQLAHNLEMSVIAEGVETEEQVELLHQLQCEGAQGFLFYKPMSFAEIEEKALLM